jgi:glycosyltransferase involved in cell wall biosynthesis
MRGHAEVTAIIPAFNEQWAIEKVILTIPVWVDDIIVVDNGSKDLTAEIARSRGARVIFEPHRGYGSACLAGIRAIGAADIVVFLDADFSDHPEEMRRLVDPIIQGRAEMVIGSRVLGSHEPGALTPQARIGNWLSCLLMRLFWGVKYSDLGPFRAITYPDLTRLGMQDPSYGWTVEMQIKAALNGVRSIEVPVSYRKRLGKSKISGTVKGVFLAGTTIMYTIFKCALKSQRSCET